MAFTKSFSSYDRPLKYQKLNTVFVWGHSFVRNYRKYLENHDKSDFPIETYAAQHIKVSDKFDQVHFCGTSGAKIMEVISIPNFKLRNFRPELVIMDIGTNDLAAGYKIRNIVQAILDLVLTFIQTYHVKQVIICSCLKREHGLRNLTMCQFEDLVYYFNYELFANCEKNQNITYHTHRGFWKQQNGDRIEVREWSSDGIHPTTTTEGLMQYSNSLKCAIHKGLQSLNLQ